MNTRLKTRLERLERSGLARRDSDLEQIISTALRAISDEDLETLRDMKLRGVRFEDCTPEQRATVRRYSVEYEAAEMRICGLRPDDSSMQPRRRFRRSMHVSADLP
jgi:hypothetical protein